MCECRSNNNNNQLWAKGRKSCVCFLFSIIMMSFQLHSLLEERELGHSLSVSSGLNSAPEDTADPYKIVVRHGIPYTILLPHVVSLRIITTLSPFGNRYVGMCCPSQATTPIIMSISDALWYLKGRVPIFAGIAGTVHSQTLLV
ncbi:unnamed protein product [Lepeophtheirus salmonis]|uniref:(salmon louse) hypothetical protein n=1 Tax=Lepeophtheirus salmonis TaxID=72036 RepID=A0A7R8H2Y8_LEPSM|nr:unnamed protein product [Lepeophtheirus salmonis]CAF2837700.1 unnamed protein product [Lepeophtheirus salmonis]